MMMSFLKALVGNTIFFFRAPWFRSANIIARKEFMQIGRNKMFLRGIVLAQFVQLMMLGFLETQTRNLPMVIVDQDHSSESRALIAKLSHTTIFEVKYITHSVSDARDLIRAGHAKAGVIIPADYRTKRAAKGVAPLLALVDGSDASASSQAVSAINGLMSDIGGAEGREAGKGEGGGIKAHSITLFNPQGRNANYMLPGLLVMMLGAMMNIPMHNILRERESGTLERLLMTPLSYWGLMLGKVFPAFVIGMVNGAIVLGAMRWIFEVPVRGSLLLIFMAIALYLLTISAIGLLLGSTGSGMEAAQKSMYLNLPNMFLSGYVFPLSGIPTLLQPIAYVLPATHMIEIMRASIMRDASLTDILPHVLYLTLVPILVIWFAVRQFRAAVGTS